VHGKPGTPEFVASYNEAIAGRTAPDTGKFRSIVTLYKGSKEFKNNAASTRAEWGKWLDRIAEYFGSLSIAQFDRSQKIKPVILRWRKQWADTPRTADYGMQVLSRVLASAVADGKIASNPCEGIKHLYHADRSEIIWLDAEITQIRSASSEEINYAVELAALTGLRLGDLVRVSWSHVGPHAIEPDPGRVSAIDDVEPPCRETRGVARNVQEREAVPVPRLSRRSCHGDECIGHVTVDNE